MQMERSTKANLLIAIYSVELSVHKVWRPQAAGIPEWTHETIGEVPATGSGKTA